MKTHLTKYQTKKKSQTASATKTKWVSKAKICKHWKYTSNIRGNIM